MAITLSETAAARVQSRIDGKSGYVGLRFGVKSSGCSGLTYVIDYAEERGEGEEIFESHGVKVLVKSDDLQYIDGTEIDYVENGLSATFQFRNPQVKDACGCGESFAVS